MDIEDLIGASILVGLTFVDSDGLERHESYIGYINAIAADDTFESLDGSNSRTITVECHDGETRSFPFDDDSLDPADPGFYELPDGATIEDPDYEMHWRVTAPTKH